MTIAEQLRRAGEEIDAPAEARLRWMLHVLLGVSALMLVGLAAWAAPNARDTWVSLGLLTGLLVATAGARLILRPGRLAPAAAFFSLSLLGLAVAMSQLLPAGFATRLLPVVVAVVVALPYLRGWAVPGLLGLALGAVGLMELSDRSGLSLERLSWDPEHAAVGLIAALVAGLLWRLSVKRDRYRAELLEGRALVESSRQQYRFLAEAIPQLVWGARPDGTVDYCNQHWMDHTGLSVEETQKSGWQAALHPEDAPAALELWHRCFAQGEPYEQVQRLRRVSDNSYRWFIARAAPVRDGDDVVRWIGSYTDIDDQKRTNEQLQESDRRKDEFIAVLGHELRNPLAPILTAVQLMHLRGNDFRATEKQRGIIERQVRQMVRLVDDLLDVSRITRNKISLQREQLDFAAAVAKAVDAASPLIVRRGHQLSVELPPGQLLLSADAVRLEQVLLNLLNNAAKYTQPGGRIWLTAEVDGSELVVKIRDNGIGLSEEAQQRLFQPFMQVAEGQELSRGGLGVGLSLVKSLVELHGGTVAVHSAGAGLGSEFTLRFPEVTASTDGSTHALSAVPTTEEEEPVGRVLVVDDNIDAAESLAEALQMEGYNVRVVHTGEAALVTAESFTPEVIILDIGLPQMDGCEVARHLRNSERTAGSYVVALSGFGQDGDRQRSAEAGFDHHLVKPVDLSQLYEIIRPRLQRTQEREIAQTG